MSGPGLPREDSQVAFEISCISCGYNLRSAQESGRCPECNTPVARTLRGDALHNSDPAWVTTLRNGVTLMLVNNVAGFVVTVVTRVAAGEQFGAVVSGLNAAIGLLAMWMITAPEPRAWRAEENVTLRKALRAFALAGLAASLVQSASILMPERSVILAGQVLALSSLPSFWLYYLHLSRLSLRLPDEKLAHHFRVIMWGMTVSFGIILLGGVFLIGAGPVAPLAAVLVCPASLAILVFGLWSLIAQIRLRSRLAIAAIISRDNAAADFPE